MANQHRAEPEVQLNEPSWTLRSTYVYQLNTPSFFAAVFSFFGRRKIFETKLCHRRHNRLTNEILCNESCEGDRTTPSFSRWMTTTRTSIYCLESIHFPLFFVKPKNSFVNKTTFILFVDTEFYYAPYTAQRYAHCTHTLFMNYPELIYNRLDLSFQFWN